jgi:hypothetical protein
VYPVTEFSQLIERKMKGVGMKVRLNDWNQGKKKEGKEIYNLISIFGNSFRHR